MVSGMKGPQASVPGRRMMAALWALALGSVALSGCQGGQDDSVLKLGLMVPLTGGLAPLGPDMRDGAVLAIEEANAAGLGFRIEHFIEDDKTSASAEAPTTFSRLTSKGVQAVVGPCCSGVTGAVLNLAVENRVVVASPSATSPALTLDRDNRGYFLRISPNDNLQGRVLAKQVQESGVTDVNLIIVDNAYGNGLAGAFRPAFEGLGGRVGKVEKIAETNAVYSSAVTSACTPKPQGMVFVLYIADAGAILKEMQAKGCLAGTKVFCSEGCYSGGQKLAEAAGKDASGKWLAEGIQGTNPQSGNSSTYNQRFQARFGHLPTQYSAESYDAVMYVVLGALKAKSTKGSEIAKNLREPANPGGEKTSDLRRAAQLIKEGQDVDWVGFAHDFEFDQRQEPNQGFYSYWRVNASGVEETTARDKAA